MVNFLGVKKKNTVLDSTDYVDDVRDIFYVIGKSFDKMHFTCIW